MSGAVLGALSVAGATVLSRFAAVNSPVSGEISGSGPCTTAAARVVASGGTAPFSYAWTKVSGADQWVINSPDEQATTFTYAGLAHSDFAAADFMVVVTDDVAATTTLHVHATVRSTSTQ